MKLLSTLFLSLFLSAGAAAHASDLVGDSDSLSFLQHAVLMAANDRDHDGHDDDHDAFPDDPSEHSDRDGDNLYYSDAAPAPLSYATTIYKVDPRGVVSTVYAGSNGASIKSYDVAADGTIYVIDDTYDATGFYQSAYKVQGGQITKIAGAPPIISGSNLAQIQNVARFGMYANDAYFDLPLGNIFDVKSGYFYLTDIRSNMLGGANGYGVGSSGIMESPPFERRSRGRAVDFCSNGDAVELAGGSVILSGYNSALPSKTIGSGVPANIASSALSHDGDDLYFVDSDTSSIMKLVGKSN